MSKKNHTEYNDVLHFLEKKAQTEGKKALTKGEARLLIVGEYKISEDQATDVLKNVTYLAAITNPDFIN